MDLTNDKLRELVIVARDIVFDIYAYDNDFTVRVTNDKRRAGYADSYENEIGISKYVMKYHSEEKCVNTLIHEMLHLKNASDGHTKGWLKDARLFNNTEYANKYGEIKRCYDMTESQILDSKYLVKCTGCGHISGRNRMCSIIRYPEEWRCGICKSKFERIK